MKPSMLALALGACAGTPMPQTEAPPQAPEVDLAAAEQSYREQAAAIVVRDVEAYRATLADPATCLEDQRDVLPSAFVEEDNLPPAYHILSLALEALPDGGARAREWIARSTIEGEEPRVEPRVVDLHRIDGRFRVTRIVSADADCGAPELLAGMSPESALAQCEQLIEACLAYYREGGVVGEYAEQSCADRRELCLRPSPRGCTEIGTRDLPEAGACSSDGWCVVHPDRPGPGPSTAVWARAADDVWFGGPRGLVHYDGASFRTIEGVGRGVTSIAGFDDGAIAVAAEGHVYLGDGRSFERVYEAAEWGQRMKAVGGRSSDGFFAVGQKGLLLRCERSGCTGMPRVTAQDLCGVVETNDGLVAIGDGGTIVRSTGSHWAVDTMELVALEDMLVDAQGRAVIVGAGLEGSLVLHREAGVWAREVVTEDALDSIVQSGDVLFAFGDGHAFTRGASGWAPFEVEPGARIEDASSGGGALLLATDRGAYARRGDAWERFAAMFYDHRATRVVRGSVPDDLWIIAERELFHWDGHAWSSQEAPFGVEGAARATDGRVLIVAGTHTAVLAGGAWTEHEHAGLYVERVEAVGTSILSFARVGSAGSIYEWRGDRWEQTLALAGTPAALLGPTSALVIEHDEMEEQEEDDDGEYERPDYRLVSIARGRRSVLLTQTDYIGSAWTDGSTIAVGSDGHLRVGRGSRLVEQPREAIEGIDRVLLVSEGHVYARARGGVAELAGGTWTVTAMPPAVGDIAQIVRVGDELWATAEGGVVLRRAR